MTIPLFDLITRLEMDVPAQDSVPTDAQYIFAVKQAATAFGRKAGMIKQEDLSVVPGTAVYALPADFLKIIRVTGSGVTYGGVQITNDGIVPLNTAVQRNWTIAGKKISFQPTPTHAFTQVLRYKAGYVLTSDEITGNPVYADMTDEVADIVMLKATALAWRTIGGKASSSQAWKYQVGDIMIDKSNLGKSLSGWIGSFDREFEKAVVDYVGHVGELA